MNKKTKILILLSTAFALIVTLSDVTSSWVAPTSGGPDGDTLPPINKGSSAQRKLGSLGVQGFASFGGATFTGKVQIKNGTQGEGRILVSDGIGNTRWVTPPKYLPGGACPDGTVMRSDGECGYTYEVYGGGYIACSPGDTRLSFYDSGEGRNHGAVAVDPNGCFSWEGRKNYGGYSCTMTCIGKVRICMKIVGGDAEWYLSGPDLLCNQ